MMFPNWTLTYYHKELMALSIPETLSDNLFEFLYNAAELMVTEKLAIKKDFESREILKTSPLSYVAAINVFALHGGSLWFLYSENQIQEKSTDYIKKLDQSIPNQFLLFQHLTGNTNPPLLYNHHWFELFYPYRTALKKQKILHDMDQAKVLANLNSVYPILFHLIDMIEAHVKQWTLFQMIPVSCKAFYLPIIYAPIYHSYLLENITYEKVVREHTKNLLNEQLEAMTIPNTVTFLTAAGTIGASYTKTDIKATIQALTEQKEKLWILLEEALSTYK